ncbi:hypothetical protein [Metallosphaera sedula]|uniref:hypothetical protein n=1 Tax=Metallosphaera sedula TaxID=43687 RepID=UPI0020C157A5|nr:hypothetical protein [Metallosphaera sedula]BBL45980.1 hypothetical protein MJ1HA_0067 [Metallosphaera sedula]
MTKMAKKKTTLAFDEDVYKVLKLVSIYLKKDMTEIIEIAVADWLVKNKEKLKELQPKIESIEERFSATDNRTSQLLLAFIELSKAPDIPYAKFLEILGLADSKEARDTYETFSLFIEKIRKLR